MSLPYHLWDRAATLPLAISPFLLPFFKLHLPPSLPPGLFPSTSHLNANTFAMRHSLPLLSLSSPSRLLSFLPFYYGATPYASSSSSVLYLSSVLAMSFCDHTESIYYLYLPPLICYHFVVNLSTLLLFSSFFACSLFSHILPNARFHFPLFF